MNWPSTPTNIQQITRRSLSKCYTPVFTETSAISTSGVFCYSHRIIRPVQSRRTTTTASVCSNLTGDRPPCFRCGDCSINHPVHRRPVHSAPFRIKQRRISYAVDSVAPASPPLVASLSRSRREGNLALMEQYIRWRNDNGHQFGRVTF